MVNSQVSLYVNPEDDDGFTQIPLLQKQEVNIAIGMILSAEG